MSNGFQLKNIGFVDQSVTQDKSNNYSLQYI